MIDTTAFAKEFTKELLHVAAEHNGAGDVEAYRRYQTDPKFHAQIDAIVMLAVQAITAVEQVSAVALPYEKAFWDEAHGLLGWDETGR
jgi:hypothetical protein